MTGWQIVEVCSNVSNYFLPKLLEKGWEPFSATHDAYGTSFWLKRRTPEGQESGILQEAVYE